MKPRIFRWKGIIPLVVLLALITGVYLLFLDTLVERGVEQAGADLVGARVDLEAATVHLARGSVSLRGLQVADPDSPMQNMVEASEVLVAVAPQPLFEKKLVIDSVIVHGVRFGTPRKESGALKNPSPTSGLIYQQVNAWAKRVSVPEFSLEGLGSKVVNIPAISPDSLRTLTQAKAIVASADSFRGSWDKQIKNLDPRPQVDTARGLLERLKAADPKALGVQGTAQMLAETRKTVSDLTGTLNRVKALEQTVSDGIVAVKASVVRLNEAQQADYAYARSLVKLPSLNAPDISPALFGKMGLEHLKPLLYWLTMAEKYMPPGLNPRVRSGPQRSRAPGITVDFPRAQAYPKFLLRFADIDFSLGGANLAAGAYRARVVGATTEPALYGRPMQLLAERSGGKVGPQSVRVFAQLAHAQSPLRDSALAQVGGVTLPTVSLAPLGARLSLGQGTTEITLYRVGEKLSGHWRVRTTNAVWNKMDSGTVSAGKPADQARRVAEDLLWRTLSGMQEVEIEAQFFGSVQQPSVSVYSNIGTVVANSLKQAMGEEIARAEGLVRAKVDSLVADGKQQVDQRVALLQTEVQDRVSQQRTDVEQVKSELEARAKEMAPRLPGGVPLPGGVRLPR